MFGFGLTRKGGGGTVGTPPAPAPVFSQLGANGAIPAGSTFTRTGVANGFDSNGDLTSYGTHTPRQNYDPLSGEVGLLIEGARTNLATHAVYDAGAWSSGGTPTITENFGVAPNGVTETTKSGSSGANNTNVYITENVPIASSSAPYSISAFFNKDAGVNDAGIAPWIRGGTQIFKFAAFDLSDGSAGFSNVAKTWIHDFNDFYRISGRETDNSSGNNMVSARILSSVFGSENTFVETWGYQIEVGEFPSSIILSDGAATTRNAETCIDTISGDTSELVLSANGIAAPGTDGDQVWLQVDDGDDNDRITIRRNSSGNIICERFVGGVEQSSIDLGAVADGVQALVEVESTSSTFRARIDGGAISTDNTGSHPSSLTTVRYGHDAAGNHMFGVLLGSDQTTGTKVEAGTLP